MYEEPWYEAMCVVYVHVCVLLCLFHAAVNLSVSFVCVCMYALDYVQSVCACKTHDNNQCVVHAIEHALERIHTRMHAQHQHINCLRIKTNQRI
jgi:hypothetical protein